MKRALFISIFISLCHLMNGQYEYFNYGYTYQEGQNEITTNVFVVEDSYVSFHLTGTEEGQKLMFRKVDQDGIILSEDTVGFEEFNSLFIQRTGSIIKDDNDYVWGGEVGGDNSYGAIAVKFNSDTYEKEWENYFPSDSLASKVFQSTTKLSDGNFIFCGVIYRDVDDDVWFEYSDLFIVKIDTYGDTLWTREISIENNQHLRVSQVSEMDNSDLILFGSKYPDRDNAIFRLTGEGELLWVHSWGEEELDDFMPRAVPEDTDGIFTMAYKKATSIYSEGSTITYGKPHLRQFNVQDTSIVGWGDIEYDHEMIECVVLDIVKTPDQGYAVVGTSGLNIGVYHYYSWILKVDSVGNELWFKEYYHIPSPVEDYPYDRLYDIEVTIDGGFIVAGEHILQNIQQSWLLKLDACGEVEYSDCPFTVDILDGTVLKTDLTVYPNPSIDNLTISFSNRIQDPSSLKIYSSFGQLIHYSQLYPGLEQEKVDLTLFSKGIYILQLINSDGELVGSEVFEKM